MILEGATSRQGAMTQTSSFDWDRIYVALAPRVYNYFRFRMGSHIDVEDLTSRTFEKAWRSRSQYRHDLSGVSTWLLKIAQNVAIDHIRARRNHVSIDDVPPLLTEETPAKDAERASNLARLAALTRDLPDRDRDLLALKYGAAANNREIANLTGLSESNVGTLLHRLVQTLRARW
jgi:RNA polymerase sigma-70 factor (ECF subfamily)